jgi:hypothetical protein
VQNAGVKRVAMAVWVPIAIVLLLGTPLFGIFNVFRLIIDKVVLTPTTGTYHEPIMTTFTVISGVVGTLVTVLLLGALAFRRLTRRPLAFPREGIGIAVLFALAGVSGLWLPFVHTNEVDIAPTGFLQPSYELAHTTTVTVYNSTPSPMTLCVGSQSHCTPDPHAPTRFNGLRLAPGQAVEVDLTDIADYSLTIATPTPGMTRLDTVMHSVITYCEDNPYAQNC